MSSSVGRNPTAAMSSTKRHIGGKLIMILRSSAQRLLTSVSQEHAGYTLVGSVPLRDARLFLSESDGVVSHYESVLCPEDFPAQPGTGGLGTGAGVGCGVVWFGGVQDVGDLCQ